MASIPVISFGAAQVATSGNAFAAKSGPTTCTGVGSTVKFAKPGLSEKGTAQASATSKAKTSAAPISCTGAKKGSGTLAKDTITSTSTTTCASDTSPPSPCPSGDFVYDSAGQLASGASTLYQEVPTTSFTIGSTSYVISNTASAVAGSGTGVGNCPSTEIGFVLTGHLTAPASQSGQASTVTACLKTDAGTGTSGNFRTDLLAEIGGNATMVITKSGFDPAASSIQFA